MDTRSVLLQAIHDIKGPEVRASAESGDDWIGSVDSLDMLEILAVFDDRTGRVTDPSQLSESFSDVEKIVTRLNQLHGLG